MRQVMSILFLLTYGMTSCMSQNHSAYYLDDSIVLLSTTKKDTAISLKGLYVKGMMKPDDGYWTVYFDKSQTQKAYEVNIEKERIDGAKIEWYRNGNRKSSGFYKDWVCIKDCQSFYETGKLKYERLRKTKNDIETYWLETGEIDRETIRMREMPVKTIEYYKSGKVRREYFYKPSEIDPSRFEPFVGVEYDTEGIVIGKLIFELRKFINPEDYSEIIELTMNTDTLTNYNK